MENTNKEISRDDLKNLTSLIFEIQYKCPQLIYKKDSLIEIENKISNSKALSPDSISSLKRHLSFYLQTLNEQLNGTPYNPLKHLASYLSKLNWQGPAEIFELINSEDVIEIYDHQGLQVYRCFNFFKFSSYSFADIITNHWWDLYERNPFIGKSLGDLAVKIFTENISGSILLDLPVHNTSEIWSLKKGMASLRHKNLIPLKDSNDKTVAIIAPIQVLDFQFTQPTFDYFVNEFSNPL